MGECNQTFDVPLHADYRGKASRLLMSRRANLRVCQRIKVEFNIVPKGTGKARLRLINQHAEQDFTSASRHNGRLLYDDDYDGR
jgi:hypothetical protein